MLAWSVCFLPAVARLTTEKNHTAGFSLIFWASVGTNILEASSATIHMQRQNSIVVSQ